MMGVLAVLGDVPTVPPAQVPTPPLCCSQPCISSPAQLTLGPSWSHQPSGAGISSVVTALKHWATHLSLLFPLWSFPFSVSSLISPPDSCTFLGPLNLFCTDDTFVAVDAPTCNAGRILLTEVMSASCWLLQLSCQHPSLLPSACTASHGTTGL